MGPLRQEIKELKDKLRQAEKDRAQRQVKTHVDKNLSKHMELYINWSEELLRHRRAGPSDR